MPKLTHVAAALCMIGLAACSTTYTADDGRNVDEHLLNQIRTYAAGERALRPAVVKSAELRDAECSHQWELPFDARTTYAIGKADDKVAWVRGAGVDEHLRVLATSSAVDLAVGDIIAKVDGYRSTNAIKMMKVLISARDHGKPFDIALASGKTVRIAPLKVCRGRVVLGEPGKNAEIQRYHWLQVDQPEQIARVGLTPEEAEWVVLWTQGLSEEAGTRMRVYQAGIGLVTFVGEAALTVATFGAGAAAGSAVIAAGSTMGAAAGQIALAMAPREAMSIASLAAGNSASLYGINWVASTRFYKADEWAFVNMQKLGMDPTAGVKLEKRLAAVGATRNAFLLDAGRQKQMAELTASFAAHDVAQSSLEMRVQTIAVHDVP